MTALASGWGSKTSPKVLFFRGMHCSFRGFLRSLMRDFNSSVGFASYSHSFVSEQTRFQQSSMFKPWRNHACVMSTQRSLGGRPTRRKFW